MPCGSGRSISRSTSYHPEDWWHLWNHRLCRSPKAFVGLVVANGATDIDDARGAAALLPGVTIASLISASSGPVTFTYGAHAGEKLNFAVQAITNLALNSTLKAITNNLGLKSAITNSGGISIITLNAIKLLISSYLSQPAPICRSLEYSQWVSHRLETLETAQHEQIPRTNDTIHM
jgi:hypothetical protein